MRNEIYYGWLENQDISNSYKKIMEEMSEDECAVAFSLQPIQFGTAGYRAKIGPGNHYLNEKTYKQLATGYARFLKNKYPNKNLKVLVTHDNRYNGMFYTDVVGSTLYENGIIPVIVENNELLPTPIASYLISKMNLDGGINITASHNPKEYNGFKCYNETGSQILPGEANKIVENLPSWKDALNSKINLDYKYEIVDKKFIEQYFDDVIKSLPNTKLFSKNLQLVYSSMHGTASYYMSKFLNKLGYVCVDVPSQNYPDHNFENALNCNPEDPISLDRAITLADTLNINIVLASDPDADRLAIAIKKDNDWIFINGNQAGIIETYYKLTQLKKTNKTPVIISTYISNNLIDRIGKKWDAKIIRTPTGFKWIGAEINKLAKNELYINGFEEAIGALPSTINRDKDSFQTAALVLEIAYNYLAKSMDYIDILEKEIFPTFGHWYGETTSIKILGHNWREIANSVFEKLQKNNLTIIGKRKIVKKLYNEKANSIDYLFENDSWVKFRISGTEPKFKIYTNLYPTNDKLVFDLEYTNQLMKESAEIVEKMKKYLGL